MDILTFQMKVDRIFLSIPNFQPTRNKTGFSKKTTKKFQLLKNSSKIQIQRYYLAIIENLKFEGYSLC